MARGGAVGSGTALQVGRSRVRFPIGSLEFFIDIILWPWGNEYQEYLLGGRKGRRNLTTLRACIPIVLPFYLHMRRVFLTLKNIYGKIVNYEIIKLKYGDFFFRTAALHSLSIYRVANEMPYL